MKVVLIYLDPLDNEPVGLMYIGTVLKGAGHEVKLVGIEKDGGEKALLRQIKLFKPDVVGLSITTPYASKAEHFAGLVKGAFPNVPVIAGGAHPTIMPGETMKKGNVDVCVIGEGERTVIELMGHYEGSAPLGDVKGIAFLDGGRLVMTEKRGYVENLDDLPFVDRGLLPEKVIYGRAGYPLQNPCMLITTVRGCPFRCTFCQPTVVSLFGKKVRKRSPANVVAEIAELKRLYGTSGLWINDDTFAFDHAWTAEFCGRLRESGADVSWWANGRINVVRRETLLKMKDAGCVALVMTFECGSERVRNEILKKGVTNEQVFKAYDISHELGILVRTNVMLGTPTETEKEMQESALMVKAVQPHFVTASYTTPIPGSYMYDEYLSDKAKEGEKEWDFYDISHFKSVESAVPEEKLKEVYAGIQKGYSGHSFVNRARHFFEVPGFRGVLYKRWKSLIFSRHPNIKHLLFDIGAIVLGSAGYILNRSKYRRQGG